MEQYKSCQSCGMPLKRDEMGGGTEKNGEKSLKYCSHCYKEGEFLYPDLSVAEMKVKVEEKIMEAGFPKFLARFFTKNIHKLERWKAIN